MKIAAVIFIGLALILIIALLVPDKREPQSPKTAAQIEEGHYGAAEYMCEQWTSQNSKLEVDKVIGWSKLKRTKPDLYSVRLEYRAKPLGTMMLTDCTYHITAENAPIIFVKGFSRRE